MKWLLIAVSDSLVHFSSSASAGLAAYCLTWTISSFCCRKAYLSPSRTSPPARVARSIDQLSWAAALFCSFAMHCWLDRC